MQSTLQPQDAERLHPNRRRGHIPQISISDESHHVTEAIGDMYGEYDWNSSRPNSYVDSKQEEEFDRARPQQHGYESTNHTQDGNFTRERDPGPNSGSLTSDHRQRTSSMGSMNGSSSTPSLTRSPSTDTANQRFPLNDIDYESSPAAVAQEISNLQAIRRMSMNVDAADPDLPAFGKEFAVPPAAPSPGSDENDRSRFYWVPASIHPELAPRDYKTFVEDRVERIRRGSGSEQGTSSTSPHRSGSGGSIGRRSSMLRKVVENSSDFRDGAEVLERKRSSGHQQHGPSMETTLEELENLVSDPQAVARKISMDSGRASMDSIGEGSTAGDDDAPILSGVPGNQALKRSTRTNYRKGSLKRGERVPFSKRAQSLRRNNPAMDDQQSPRSPISDDGFDLGTNGISRSLTEPVPPVPKIESQHFTTSPDSSSAGLVDDGRSPPDSPRASVEQQQQQTQPQSRSFQSRIASNGRTTAQLPGIPNAGTLRPASSPNPYYPQPTPQQVHRPERSSSQEYSRHAHYYNGAQSKAKPRPTQTLNDMAKNPSVMPGTNTNTDALSFIPTFEGDAKPEKEKKSKSKDMEGGRKSGWSWFSRNDTKDSDKKDRDGEKEEKDLVKKAKNKLRVSDKHDNKSQDGKYDNTRLDVLQTTADGSRGRESLVLDRDSIKLEEERKKDNSARKTSSDGQKKEPGLLQTLFGGKKKSSDGMNKKKETNRGHSPEPVRAILRPDIDFNWTRFSIMEERAIYRMAHIKLANPRRALYSQVLLSNFMYSYLAKVQQNHLIPEFIQKQQQKGQQSSVEQAPPPVPDEYQQWASYQQSQELAQAQSKGSYQPNSNTSPSFVEDYDPAHQQQQDYEAQQHHHQQQQAAYYHMYSQQQQQQQSPQHHDPYTQQGLFDDINPRNDDDLW